MTDMITIISAEAWTTSGIPTGRLQFFQAAPGAHAILHQEMRYETGSTIGAVSYWLEWVPVPLVMGAP